MCIRDRYITYLYGLLPVFVVERDVVLDVEIPNCLLATLNPLTPGAALTPALRYANADLYRQIVGLN